MDTAEIRKRFLQYFEGAGHTVVPSASLLLDDPNLLFVNAGMVPFKPYFLGQETPPYPRAASVQKCVRTLDIEEVGKTTRHGTFFQMNGNFSFGDYFKEGAIKHAWTFITSSQEAGGLGIDPEKIWVTVLHSDDEARELWKSIAGLPEERIQSRGLLDNYWNMGVAGPAGPCSEIYVDRGPEFGPDGGPIVDEDRFLEIWNLVFMQEELSEVRAKDDFTVMRELPAKNIDTGMGLERVAYLLQGKKNIYEIDEVYPVIERACEISGAVYGANDQDDIRLRIVADHVRSSLMLIGDGVVPSNEGRGYVLRRLLRRSVRSMRLLGVETPVLPELLPVSLAKMAVSYPELEREKERITQIAYAEEVAFRQTLANGTVIFETAAAEAKSAGKKTLSGEDAFKLHDTYGFPIDLTLEMANEAGLSVDEASFRDLMAGQRERAKADAKAKKGQHADTSIYRDALSEVGETEFLALQSIAESARVRKILTESGAAKEAVPGDIVEVILDRTPFYAEAGGQSADAGHLRWDGGMAEVLDVQRPIAGLVTHQVRITDGALSSTAEVEALVDPKWRHGATQAHSATHVIGAAIRESLGPAASQSGSFNRPGYLRLDFNWNSGLSEETLEFIERKSNEIIQQDLPVGVEVMPKAQAMAMGAQALFGEKYPEVVRVVEINGPWSLELCGGTHVESTAQIGTMVLTHEGSVSAGNRRVELVTGFDGFGYLARERDLVRELSNMLKTSPADLQTRVADLVDRLKSAEKQIEKIKAERLLASAATIAGEAVNLGNVTLLAKSLPDVSGGDLRTLALDLRARLGTDRPAVVVLLGVSDGKVATIAALNESAVAAGISANNILQTMASHIDGRGGGKADLAQGGGANPSGLDAALGAVQASLT